MSDRFATGLGAIVVTIALLVPTLGWAQIPKTAEERGEAMRGLDWQRQGGAFHLDGSSSMLKVGPQHLTLLGHDARRFYELTNGVTPPTSLEATVVDRDTDALVMLRSTREGYVRFDDWADVDADAMMSEIKEGTTEANKQRRSVNISPIEVVGWRQKPTLDRDQHTVSWAIEARDGQETLVNASLLTFGRHGYEKLTWAGPGDLDPADLLNQVRAGFQFDSGATYADFRDGDKVAEYGVAALVASAVGAKVAAKLGLLAAALLFLKKGWILVLAVVGGLVSLWRKLRKRRSSATGA